MVFPLSRRQSLGRSFKKLLDFGLKLSQNQNSKKCIITIALTKILIFDRMGASQKSMFVKKSTFPNCLNRRNNYKKSYCYDHYLTKMYIWESRVKISSWSVLPFRRNFLQPFWQQSFEKNAVKFFGAEYKHANISETIFRLSTFWNSQVVWPFVLTNYFFFLNALPEFFSTKWVDKWF